MAIDTIIIPQQVNLENDVDAVTIKYEVTGTSGDKKLLQIGIVTTDKLAELNLRTTILEANAGINGATDDFEDIFSDVDGLLDTVNTTDTNSSYDSTTDQYINYSTGGVVSEPSFETVSNWTYSETDSDFSGGQSTDHPTKGTYSYRLGSTNTSTKSSGSYCQILQNIDVTNVNQLIFDWYNGYTSNTRPSLKVYIGSNLVYNKRLYDTSAGAHNNITIDTSSYTGTQDLIFRFIVDADWGYTGNVYIDNIRTALSTPGNQNLVLTYNKGNPTAIYCLLYSGSTSADDIGDCEIEFYTGSTLLGTFSPYTLYTGLSFATTPNKIIIKQKNTEISKIAKYVVLIQD